MRTTLAIDDALFRRAKEYAARNGVTLGRVVDEGLRELLRRASDHGPARGPYRMQTCGGGSKRVCHEPSDFAMALAEEDAEANE